MLFVKNMVFLDGAIATLAPDLDIFAEIANISMHFAEKHGERIMAELGMDARPELGARPDRLQGQLRRRRRRRGADLPRAARAPREDPRQNLREADGASGGADGDAAARSHRPRVDRSPSSAAPPSGRRRRRRPAPGLRLALDRGRQPPRHRPAVRRRRGRRRAASSPAVRDRLFVAGKTLRHEPRRRARPVRRDPPPARRATCSTSTRPTPSRRSTSSTPRADALDAIVSLRDAGRRPVRRHHRPRPRRARRPARGAAPLGPRHRDVPGQPAPVGRRRVPGRRPRRCSTMCAERDVGVHGDQGGRPPPVGRGRRRAAGRRPGTSRTATRPPSPTASRFALSTPGVHAICTPGDLGLLPGRPRRVRRRSLPMDEAERDDGDRAGSIRSGGGDLPDPAR